MKKRVMTQITVDIWHEEDIDDISSKFVDWLNCMGDIVDWGNFCTKEVDQEG